MDEMYSKELLTLGASLSELAIKGTAITISSKIKAIKEERNAEKIRNTYDEIVNELLAERQEAIRIAQVYKSEFEKVSISDEDFHHLHNTVERVLEIIKEMQIASGSGDELPKQLEEFEQIKEFISVDTLKTIQLLGFNFKAAIGEPLTMILRNWILSKVVEVDRLRDFERMVTPQMVEILKNKDAYENFKAFMNINDNNN